MKIGEKGNIGDQFIWYNQKWQIVDIRYTGSKTSVDYYAENVLKDGSLGKYQLVAKWVSINLKLTGDMTYNMGLHNARKMLKNPPEQAIPFEYASVSKWSREAEKIIKAKEIKIGKNEALDIISMFCKKFNVSMAKGLWEFKYKNGVSRGGKIWRNGKLIPFMKICMDNGYTDVWLICHEFAHVLHFNRMKQIKDRTPHGKKFTKILDRLVVYYFDIINNAKLSAAAKHERNG